MKNILKTTTLALVCSMALTGCIKETFPTDSATSGQVSDSPTAVEAIVNAIPVNMTYPYSVYGRTNNYGFDFGYPGMMCATDAATGDVICSSGDEGSGYDWFTYWQSGILIGPTQTVCRFPWNCYYTFIKSSNDVVGLLAGVDMTIYKRVPVRAGMAGGSADAAGVLVGLNELYNARLSMSELCAIGAGIGADVPFALLGGTCRVRGVGDLMKALPPCPDCWFVVAMPSVGVSTPEAFARYDTMGSPVHPDCEAQEQAIRANDLRGVCAAAGNALEHCSGAVETPAICKTLRAHGAVTAQMTGSGAAVFGIFDDENAARNAAVELKKGYKQVYVCKPTHGGPRVTVRRAFGTKK